MTPTQEYKTALTAATVGSAVAHADQALVEAETSILSALAAGLTRGENAYLKANIKWMREVPPTLPLLRQLVRQASEEARKQAAKVAIAMAAADGQITPAEIRTLEKVAKDLNINDGELYSALHTGAPADEPVTIIPKGNEEKVFTIPHPPAVRTAGGLDEDLIAKLRDESARGFEILAAIFEDPEEEEESGTASPPPGTEELLPGMDRQHAALLTSILDTDQWDETTFATLARKHSLMAAGASETINDWAIENYGEPLVEDDGETLNQELHTVIRLGAGE